MPAKRNPSAVAFLAVRMMDRTMARGFRAVTVAARHCFVAVITRLLTDAFPFIASYQCHVSRATSFRRQLLDKRTVSFTWTGVSLVLVIALELLTDRPVVSWTIDVLRQSNLS